MEVFMMLVKLAVWRARPVLISFKYREELSLHTCGQIFQGPLRCRLVKMVVPKGVVLRETEAKAPPAFIDYYRPTISTRYPRAVHGIGRDLPSSGYSNHGSGARLWVEASLVFASPISMSTG
jgi:hypothetical protein